VKADFNSADNFHCKIPHTVHLDNNTDSLDATSVSYKWRVLDGTTPVYTSKKANPNFTFNSIPDLYSVELIATGNNGCLDTLTRSDFIYQDSMKVQFDANPKI